MHHTIIAMDVAGFGVRNLWHQGRVRDGLYTSARDAFDHCGVPLAKCHVEDRGDGLLVVLPTDAPSIRLVECLPYELAARLREHNAGAAPEARIRLRLAIHAGEIARDGHGFPARP